MSKFKLSYDDYNITKSIIDDIIENYQENGYEKNQMSTQLTMI
jgi:hypothetical protein